ncbi:RHS repeat-associated core domain-containing protein [Vreelandella stevensii]|uniref:RHS repeat-associated core domain-containing protein n=1 Tax=Vreelandella stevensii TaxID=502821 RepID=UPI003748A8DF
MRFQGQWHDEESGLYYNRHRYYDPQQGRYISQDPIGLVGGDNLYQYAAAPNLEVDPLGLRGVYGLGGGPYSQSNMIRTQARDLVGSIEPNLSAEAFSGFFGQTVSTGLKFDTHGNTAWVVSECHQYGVGLFRGVGAGGSLGISSAPLENGVSETVGPFIRAGIVKGGGNSIAGATGWIGPSYGMASGIQHCKTTTTVLGTNGNE